MEETDDNYPDVIEDPSLPKLSYEDYVKQHYAPHWAGYYVIGCSKDSEQDVQRLIDALFSWKEVQPFL